MNELKRVRKTIESAIAVWLRKIHFFSFLSIKDIWLKKERNWIELAIAVTAVALFTSFIIDFINIDWVNMQQLCWRQITVIILLLASLNSFNNSNKCLYLKLLEWRESDKRNVIFDFPLAHKFNKLNCIRSNANSTHQIK